MRVNKPTQMDFEEEKQKSPESKPYMKAHVLIRGEKKPFF